ncbi:sodium/nucleoside cotransporter 1 isoform X1 [Canis lupus familiaris]|uniref:sodium/nucleoside cotransporter 1 isoform X1 n=1 Tax=Canis lupus familiaris TaxID=9615 RepID=UPI0018F7E064|nr:sodium/nucleoside cotransporter 1 isoform X1 [Canis lupus familiaris]
MEDDAPRRRESISLTFVANGLENKGVELLESLEEGRIPGHDSGPEEGGDNRNEASPEPFSGWRSLQPALRATRRFCREHAQLFQWICTGLLSTDTHRDHACHLSACFAFAAFLLTAGLLDFQRALALFVLTCVVLTFLAHSLLRRLLGPRLLRCVKPLGHCRLSFWVERENTHVCKRGVEEQREREAARQPCGQQGPPSSPGPASWSPSRFLLCFVFCFQIFLSYTDVGSSFVFGEAMVKGVFAFQVLPIVIFFSCVMSVLYYVGLMQWVIQKISWLMQTTMGTTATETLSVAGNIFVSQTEAPLLIQPYLADMTLSEIHAVMTGGYATIAGSLLGAYISFGIDAASLIAASVMAAPCALALSKLVYPEVEESKFRSPEGVELTCGDAQNLLEAASSGAAVSVKLVANIGANLIAFLALLAFINAALSWLGAMVGVQELSFQLICSYALRPVAFLMGVAWEDCPVVAELLGIKLFLNEFVAYQGLSQYKQRRLSGAEEWVGPKKQWISVRAEILTTFALCGFANFSSIGIMLGGLTSMAPRRKSDFSQIVLRALCTGTCVSLVNACVAGILYVPRGIAADCRTLLNATLSNSSFEVYQCCRQAFQSTNPEVSRGALDICCRFYNHTICA